MSHTNIIPLPTNSAIEQAWARYAALARAVLETPDLLLDRDHAQKLVVAWEEWRDLYLAGRVK
jgi:hypothetical protein